MSAYNNFGVVDRSGASQGMRATADDFRRHTPKLLESSPSKPQPDKLSLPFKRDYTIMFHDSDTYKVSINATAEGLQLLLISLFDHTMWKGEFPSEYLEDISRKTGRELKFIQYIEMLN